MIRLTSIMLDGFKNVAHGYISLSSWKASEKGRRSDIVGIYGQNGSGKTSVVYAMSILRALMLGERLPEVAAECVALGRNSAGITVEALAFDADASLPTAAIKYAVEFLRSGERGIRSIAHETITYKNLQEPGSVTRTLLDFSIDYSRESPYLLAPKSAWDAVSHIDKATVADVLVAERVADRSATSLVFSEEFTGLIEGLHLRYDAESAASRTLSKGATEAMENVVAPVSYVQTQLRSFAFCDFAVITPARQAEPSLNYLRIATHEGDLGELADVSINIDLTRPTVVEPQYKDALESTIATISSVLSSLVPGLALSARWLGTELNESAVQVERFELVATRDGTTVPLRCESEGIKKLVGILVLLIDVYAKQGACIVVDELDSGVFEYLLGDLLDVLQRHGKGQLIFTAHNLRPLETILKDSIVFTTTNPRNRYIRFRGMKATNNLRDQYLRAITLGGQTEVVYEPTSKFEIDNAFYGASHPTEGR